MTAVGTPKTIAELMAQAYAMERDAVARYREFADVMQVHNNPEVAALFCALADQEALHAEQIAGAMGWAAPPASIAQRAPGAPSLDDAHYLMQPWHVLQLALQAEQQACDFFGGIAARCTDDELREAARELEEEERGHIEILRTWIERIPLPAGNWDDDPDPPRYNE
ncbi:ferritin family protein [Ramlibacter albus]|uniref:Ferritin family protein n=1 Tax=Ramlibacter albus TaxID=2079448 RepID=A0A923MDP3_9BURK|nr:ferritin family protein [Ramlibacter albus]MBC5768115.1 ferritin family protein [Ramlibacter albus]